MDTPLDTFQKIENLCREILDALEQGRHYDVFLLMQERSKLISQLMDEAPLPEEQIGNAIRDTHRIQTKIEDAVQSLSEALVHETNTAAARRAYAKSMALRSDV